MTSLAYTLAVRATIVLGGNFGRRKLNEATLQAAVDQVAQLAPCATDRDKADAVRVMREDLFSGRPDASSPQYEDVRYQLYGTPPLDDAYYFQADE